jgi:hypothetical protein
VQRLVRRILPVLLPSVSPDLPEISGVLLKVFWHLDPVLNQQMLQLKTPLFFDIHHLLCLLVDPLVSIEFFL